jgi:pimeloyl-ACP methyl ester carboxylesterase
MSHRFGLVESFDARPRLGAVRVPALALAGDRDLLVSPQALAELVRGIPGAKEVRLRGCGHLAFATRPEAVAAAVADFLRGC